MNKMSFRLVLALFSTVLGVAGCAVEPVESEPDEAAVDRVDGDENAGEAQQSLAMGCSSGCFNSYHLCLKRCWYNYECKVDCSDDYSGCLLMCPQP